METRTTVVALFLSSIEALLADDLKLPWTIDTFAHEIIYLAQATGIPFDYDFAWTAGAPHADLLEQDLLLIDRPEDDDGFILRDDALRWILPTHHRIRPPEGLDPFRFDEWLAAVCLAERLRAQGTPCTTLVSALLAEAPALARFAPEAVLRVC